MKKYLWLILLMQIACTAEEIGPQEVDSVDASTIRGKKILMINEGNFGYGNASIDAYVPQKKEVFSAVFKGANQGAGVGDVAQDIIRYNDRYYISVNASGYVLVTDTINLQIRDSIKGGMLAPRYMAAHEASGFVTDLFTNKLWVVDLSTNQLKTHVSLPGKGKQVLRWNDKIVVSVGDQLVVVDAFSYTADTVVTMNSTVSGIVNSPDGALWILSVGNSANSAQLCRIGENLNTRECFSITGVNPGYLSIDRNNAVMYFVKHDGIYSLQYTGTGLSVNQFFPLIDQNVYALEVDPKSGDLYLVDALDFNQRSDVLRINSAGMLIHQFKAGIITTGFYFPE